MLLVAATPGTFVDVSAAPFPHRYQFRSVDIKTAVAFGGAKAVALLKKPNSWIVDASSVVTAALSVIRASAELCSRLLSPVLLLYIETPPGDDVDNRLVQPQTHRRPEKKRKPLRWSRSRLVSVGNRVDCVVQLRSRIWIFWRGRWLFHNGSCRYIWRFTVVFLYAYISLC